MIRILRYLMVLSILLIATPFSSVYAVSPYPPELQPQEEEEKVFAPGETVCLFESGTTDVKQVIKEKDTLVVYRENPDHTFAEVGKIMVLTYFGENFIKAQVVEGKLKVNDIAKKGVVAILIISTEIDCQ